MGSLSSGKRMNVLPAIATALRRVLDRGAVITCWVINESVNDAVCPTEDCNPTVGNNRRVDAETDVTSRLTRTPARHRSNRRLVKNCRRLHCRALDASRVARGNSVRPPSSTRALQRARQSPILRKLNSASPLKPSATSVSASADSRAVAFRPRGKYAQALQHRDSPRYTPNAPWSLLRFTGARRAS